MVKLLASTPCAMDRVENHFINDHRTWCVVLLKCFKIIIVEIIELLSLSDSYPFVPVQSQSPTLIRHQHPFPRDVAVLTYIVLIRAT